jgi:deoxyadenosine/deoxycytidine kinase
MTARSIQEHPQFGSRLIAIEGAIGVGKTSLVRLLSRRWKAAQQFEVFEENPFLTGGFYEQPQKLAFNTEIFFLLSRFRQQQGLANERGLVLSDYLFEKSQIFAEMTLDKSDHKIFKAVYDQLLPEVPRPDLVIHLTANAETLLRRIYFRDRQFERSISADYIERLIQKYRDFFQFYQGAPVLTIDASSIDFVADSGDFERVASLIEDRLKGQIQLSLMDRAKNRAETKDREARA